MFSGRKGCNLFFFVCVRAVTVFFFFLEKTTTTISRSERESPAERGLTSLLCSRLRPEAAKQIARCGGRITIKAPVRSARQWHSGAACLSCVRAKHAERQSQSRLRSHPLYLLCFSSTPPSLSDQFHPTLPGLPPQKNKLAINRNRTRGKIDWRRKINYCSNGSLVIFKGAVRDFLM